MKRSTPEEIAELTTQLPTMNIAGMAREVRRDWPKPYFGAVPYIGAMASLDSIGNQFGNDDGKSIVAYFLSNAATWRGPVAKLVKAELNKRLKAK